jgi:Icc protein
MKSARPGWISWSLTAIFFHDDPKYLPAVKRAFHRLTMPYFVTRGNHDQVDGTVWQQTWGYPLNHSFVRGEYAFVLLDTSDGKGGFLCPDREVLRAELARYADKKGIHVFMHISPVPGSAFGTTCPEVLDLLDKAPNVKAIYHGHDHEADGRKMAGSKPYFWDAHFGGSWGTAYKGYRITEINADGYWKTYQYNPTATPVLNAYDGKMSF